MISSGGGQAAVAQASEEVVPRVEGLASAGRQADEDRLAAGGDAPGGQHRLGRGAGVHPEEAGVQEQVVQGDRIEPAMRPGLVLILDLAADSRHRRLGDRGLIAECVSEGGLHIADRQAPHERRNDKALQGIGLGDMCAEQAGGERLASAAQLGPG